MKGDKKTPNVQAYKSSIIPSELENKSIHFTDYNIESIFGKIVSHSNFQLDDCEVGNGIDVLQDFVSNKHLQKLSLGAVNKGDGIFVLTDKEISNLRLTSKELAYCKPYYTALNLKKYFWNQDTNHKIIYADEKFRKNINQYPNLKTHLDRFKVVMTSAFKPYGLHRSREQKLFEGEKLFSLRKTKNVSFTYTNGPCYVSRAFLIIQTKRVSQKYLCGLLNSKVVNFWLHQKGKKQGAQLQVDKEPLLNVPLIVPSDQKILTRIENIVDSIIESNNKHITIKSATDKEYLEHRIKSLENQIDNIINDLYELKSDEISIIERQAVYVQDEVEETEEEIEMV